VPFRNAADRDQFPVNRDWERFGEETPERKLHCSIGTRSMDEDERNNGDNNNSSHYGVAFGSWSTQSKTTVGGVCHIVPRSRYPRVSLIRIRAPNHVSPLVITLLLLIV
jgi:hypothetical protein